VGWQQDSAREGYILLMSTAFFDTLSESDVNSIGAGGRLGECTEAGKSQLTYSTHIKTKVGRQLDLVAISFVLHFFRSEQGLLKH